MLALEAVVPCGAAACPNERGAVARANECMTHQPTCSHATSCFALCSRASCSPALMEAQSPVGRQCGAANQLGELAHDIQGPGTHQDVLQRDQWTKQVTRKESISWAGVLDHQRSTTSHAPGAFQ